MYEHDFFDLTRVEFNRLLKISEWHLEACMCLCWNQDELRALCARHINIKRAVDNVLSSHMARKLSDNTEGRTNPETAAVEPG